MTCKFLPIYSKLRHLPLPTNTFYVGKTILEAPDIASEHYPNMKETGNLSQGGSF
jgi:hypothetical protein